MTLQLLVDVEALTIDFLKNQADVKALINEEVSQDLPKLAKRPRVRVFRLPGPGTGYPAWLEDVRLQVESWADTRDLANDVARTTQAALLEQLAGTHSTGVVTHVREVMGPAWLPDPVETPATPRYVAVVAVFAHPL